MDAAPVDVETLLDLERFRPDALDPEACYCAIETRDSIDAAAGGAV